MKFIVTHELGRLARWLRILGYDTAYDATGDMSKCVLISLRETRIIITRDRKLSRFTGIRMFRIRNDDVEEQLAQVIDGLGLKTSEEKIFQRCVDCNTPLTDAAKGEIEKKVPPYVFETNDEFKICSVCNKVFWKGTHWHVARKFLKTMKKKSRTSRGGNRKTGG